MLKDSSSATNEHGLEATPSPQNMSASNVLTPLVPSVRLPWGPIASILYAALVYVVMQLGAVLLLSLVLRAFGWDSTRINQWLTNDTFAQFMYILLAEGFTIGAVVWFVHRRGAKLRAIGWNRFQVKYLWMALAGFGVYFIGYIVTTIVASALVPSLNLNQKQEIGFQDAHSTVGLALTFISLVVLPPLAEETVFRGFLFGGIRRRFSFWPAALLTSALFAIPHLQFGEGAPLLWVAALDTLVLSLVLCFVRERTKSLWPGILIHGLKNGIAFVALFLIT